MRDLPRKKHILVVDLRVSGKAPQTEPENPLRHKAEEELKKKP